MIAGRTIHRGIAQMEKYIYRYDKMKFVTVNYESISEYLFRAIPAFIVLILLIAVFFIK